MSEPAPRPGKSTKEIAEIFSVTTKAVHDWIRAGMPVLEEGSQGAGNEARIDLEAATRWYFRDNFERFELDRQRTSLAAEQARRIAIENAVRAGELGELKLWQEELEKHFGEVRAALLALPTKLAPRLDGDINHRKDRLEAAIHEVLRRFATYRPTVPGRRGATPDLAREAGLEPPAKANGKRVGGRVSKAIKRKQRGARRLAN